MEFISTLCALLVGLAVVLAPIMFFVFIIMLCCKAKLKKVFGFITLGLVYSILPLTIIGVITEPSTWCEHKYEVIEQTDATCKEKGYISKKCSECGDEETEEIELADHIWNVIEETQASCTSQGSKVNGCSVCNITETVITEMIPHSLSVDRTEEATCSHPNQEHKKCSNCNYTEVKSIGEALPHSYGNWVIDKEATAESAGTQSQTCLVCQHKVTEEIKKLSPITFLSIRYNIDSVGGVEWNFEIKSNSQKTIKYITMYWNCYNAVGDLVKDQITGKTNYGIKITGPIEYGYSSTWNNTSKFYNHNFDHLKMTKVQVEFMDGTVVQITEKEYSNIFATSNN